MISEAKLAANRRNGAKGGVKTREGKLKSRRNALKHGHCAEVVVPDDFQAEVEERFRQLADEVRPEGVVETGFARRMAVELVKLERLEREEHAALAARVRRAGEDFDDRQRRRVEACVELLPKQPARAVRGLLAFTAGCNWLLGEWGELRAKLDAGGWDEADVRRAWLLLGGREVDPGGPTLAACLADEIAAVAAERDAVWEELDGPLRQEAEDRALLDTSADGQMRHRYEGQAVRHLHKVVDQFCKGRQGWFQPRPPRRGRSAPNEPTAEVVKEAVFATMEPAGESAPGADETPVGDGPHPGPLAGGEGGNAVAAPNEPTAEGLSPAPVASADLPPSPRGGDGAGAPNEPTAEVDTKQGLMGQQPAADGAIRREVFLAPTPPLPAPVIDGIRVR